MNWIDALQPETEKPYFKNLQAFLDAEYKTQTVYPPANQVLNALELTPLENVKCVILGQDPYHGPNQAMGLSFSVAPGIALPRSLQNIYKELQAEFGYDIPTTGDLTKWAQQGVLLLNSVLTVRRGDPGSHKDIGWEAYTDAILKAVNQKAEPVVYMLWGNFAKSKKELITNQNHLILEAAHPSPYSANKGFFGCDHFKTCNQYLMSHNQTPIDWQIQ